MNLTLKRNKKGFTLLEIIIVVIIVGVLASLALPRLFSTVEFSRSTEALAAVGSIRSALERCSLRNGTGTYAGCTMAALDLDDPSNTAGTHFTYTITNQGVGTYTITAVRNTLDAGAAASNIILTATAGAITKSGNTAFADIR
jgi:type IV pilus assembly protein PilA